MKTRIYATPAAKGLISMTLTPMPAIKLTLDTPLKVPEMHFAQCGCQPFRDSRLIMQNPF